MINTVHWSEADESKAQIMRDAAEQLAQESCRVRVENYSALLIERIFKEVDDSALARLCDILKGER
jgi:hypothetical protein